MVYALDYSVYREEFKVCLGDVDAALDREGDKYRKLKNDYPLNIRVRSGDEIEKIELALRKYLKQNMEGFVLTEQEEKAQHQKIVEACKNFKLDASSQHGFIGWYDKWTKRGVLKKNLVALADCKLPEFYGYLRKHQENLGRSIPFIVYIAYAIEFYGQQDGIREWKEVFQDGELEKWVDKAKGTENSHFNYKRLIREKRKLLNGRRSEDSGKIAVLDRGIQMILQNMQVELADYTLPQPSREVEHKGENEESKESKNSSSPLENSQPQNKGADVTINGETIHLEPISRKEAKEIIARREQQMRAKKRVSMFESSSSQSSGSS